MKIALLGYGNVGRAFARLLESKRSVYPFPIVGIHTAQHGTAFNAKGLGLQPEFGPTAGTVDEFLERAQPSVLIEITTLNPESGEPAISHVRSAFRMLMPNCGTARDSLGWIPFRIDGNGWSTCV